MFYHKPSASGPWIVQFYVFGSDRETWASVCRLVQDREELWTVEAAKIFDIGENRYITGEGNVRHISSRWHYCDPVAYLFMHEWQLGATKDMQILRFERDEFMRANVRFTEATAPTVSEAFRPLPRIPCRPKLTAKQREKLSHALKLIC